MIRLTAVRNPASPRPRDGDARAGRPKRARFELALVAVLSDGGLRRSEAAALTWGDVQRWDDGSGRITVVRSKTDVEAQGATVAVTPVAMKALWKPSGRRALASEEKVFGLSESQIARRVKAIARGRRPGRLGESSAATAGGWAWPAGWPRTARPPTRSNARAAGNRAAAWSAATPAAKPQDRRCGIFSCSQSPQNSYSETCGLRVFCARAGGTGPPVQRLHYQGSFSARARGNRRRSRRPPWGHRSILARAGRTFRWR